MNNRIIVNITASASWRHRPVGIIRVERELVKQLNRRFDENIISVVFDNDENIWKEIPKNILSQVLSDQWVLSDNPSAETNIDISQFKTLKPQFNDRFISAGSDWSFSVPDLVHKIYGSNRVLISACYDLIPLIYPEFTPGPEFYDQFNKHYMSIAKYAKSVFSISENSKKDLLDFWSKNNTHKSLPTVDVIPLAGFSERKRTTLNENDNNRFNQIKLHGDYVIFVSTLEPRKNHQLLIDIWSQLYKQRGAACPTLLIVGMRGWGCSDLLNQLQKMEAVKSGKIKWEEGVGDELLFQLYENSLFSVFPSFYEGWGLAATEALSFGKVCIVSNNSSLIEATSSLNPSYHPLDFHGWYEEISRLIDDKLYKTQLEDKIKGFSYSRSWDDFGFEFVENILKL